MVTAWTELEFIAKRLHGRVLDAGCGNGDYSVFLKKLKGVTGVVSLDIQDIDTPHHGKIFKQTVPGGKFVQGDVQNLHMFRDDEFDCVLSWDMLQNVEDAPKAFSEFARVTRNGGLVTVRTIVKGTIPWVTPGVTIEKGSSGYPFTVWTVWDPEDMRREGARAGLFELERHLDPWNHQTFLFEVRK